MAAKLPGHSPAELLAGVLDLLRQPIDPTVAAAWSWHATRYLFNRMVQVGDFAGALRAAKQLAELAEKLPGGEPLNEPAGNDLVESPTQPAPS